MKKAPSWRIGLFLRAFQTAFGKITWRNVVSSLFEWIIQLKRWIVCIYVLLPITRIQSTFLVLWAHVFFLLEEIHVPWMFNFFLEIPRPLIDFDSGVRKQKYQNSWVVNRFHLGFSIKWPQPQELKQTQMRSWQIHIAEWICFKFI